MDTSRDSNSANIILDKAERSKIIRSEHKCPFLKIGPIIPLANQYYGHCTLLENLKQSVAREKKYIYDYCCNFENDSAFKKCQIWLDNQHNEQ